MKHSFTQKKSLFYTSLTIISAIVIVITLCLFTEDSYNRKNDFSRNFFNTPLLQLHIAEIKEDNVVSVIGASQTHFYFLTLYPGKILITDTSLSNAQFLKLPFANDKKIISNFNMHVDSPFLYIY